MQLKHSWIYDIWGIYQLVFDLKLTKNISRFWVTVHKHTNKQFANKQTDWQNIQKQTIEQAAWYDRIIIASSKCDDYILIS